jgi:hypothetical protein
LCEWRAIVLGGRERFYWLESKDVTGFRWGGGRPGVGGSGRTRLEKKEEVVLLGLLARLLHVFVTLMNELECPGLPDLCNVPGWHPFAPNRNNEHREKWGGGSLTPEILNFRPA